MALVTQFLSSIRGFVLQQDGDQLRDWLKVEQNASSQYYELQAQLRSGFPARSKALERFVEKCLPEEDDVSDGKGSPWPGFVSFMVDYLQYWRDVNFDDLLGLHELLSTLLTSCATALQNPTYGAMMLRTSISLSESMSKLVMTLHRRPDLTSQLRVASGDEEKKSFVESAADTIQKIFTSCLTDRSSTRWSKPEGKKVGVYIFANLVLKLLFTCNKSRLAVQMFTNIATSGPALGLFPAAQRVTYLYYLGRFYFEHNNFMRSAVCLDEAYIQTPPAAQKHRRLILTYLIPANILLGRFPSETLLNRPEAATLSPIYRPLIQSIKAGNFVAFQAIMKTHEPWLFTHGLFITLNFRLRPFLWRSLARRTFLLTYTPPADAATSRRAATLDLHDVVTTASYQQHLLEGWTPANAPPRAAAHHQHHHGQNPVFLKAVRNSASATAAATDSTLAPPPAGKHRRLRPCDGILCGNLAVTLGEVEGMVATLVGQSLMHGFVAHGQGKFAVVGTKQKGSAVLAGWPEVAGAVRERMRDQGAEMDNVPAWVKAP